MRDTSKKAYFVDKPYTDFIRTTPGRNIWNKVTEQEPGLSEFNAIDRWRLTPSEIALLRYIRQSEAKKPYAGMGYEEMEYTWEGPHPGVWPIVDPGGDGAIDLPDTFPTGDPIITDIPGQGFWVLHVIVDGGFCAGQTTYVNLYGSHPIYSWEPKYPSYLDPGTSITIVDGLGTNTVRLKVIAGVDEGPGQIDGHAYLQAFDAPETGTAGKGFTDADISGSNDCCPDVCSFAWDTTPATMARSASAAITADDGNGPYTWAISGTGFTLTSSETETPSNTINTDGTACGVGIITLTDACMCELSWEVRCTAVSSWVYKGSGCGITGAATFVPSSPPIMAYRTFGGDRQIDSYADTFCFRGTCPGCVGPRPYVGSTCITPLPCGSWFTWDGVCASYPRKCYKTGTGIYDMYSITNARYEWECD